MIYIFIDNSVTADCRCAGFYDARALIIYNQLVNIFGRVNSVFILHLSSKNTTKSKIQNTLNWRERILNGNLKEH